jgi:hypothetical protein
MSSTATRARERGSAVAATLALLATTTGLATTLLGLAPAMRPWTFSDADATVSASLATPSGAPEPGSHDVETGTPTSVALDTDRGPGGSTARVGGDGFGAGERVAIRFDTDEVAHATTDEHGRFRGVVLTVPTDYGAFAPATFTVTATGDETARSADVTFTLTG